jgi:hypothetical protein
MQDLIKQVPSVMPKRTKHGSIFHSQELSSFLWTNRLSMDMNYYSALICKCMTVGQNAHICFHVRT